MWQSPVTSVNIGTIIFLHQSFLLIMSEPLRGNNVLPANNIPFVASIAIKLPDDVKYRLHLCSGSLIASNLVLTAAHCLEAHRYNMLDVVVGVTDLRNWKVKYTVRTWVTFDKWAAKKDPRMIRLPFNDVAIIKLNGRVSEITPANITTLRTASLYGKNATIVGWTDGKDGVARYLKKAQVQILTAMDCEQRYKLLTNVVAETPVGQLCTAANPFTLTTEGDSGGPLLDENNNILGVTRGFCPRSSFNCTQELADQSRFNVHIDFVDEYRQFIDDIKNSSS